MDNDTRKFEPLKGLSSGNFSQIAGVLIANLKAANAALTTSCDLKAAEIKTLKDTIKDQEGMIKSLKQKLK